MGAGSSLFPVMLYNYMWSLWGDCRRVALGVGWVLSLSGSCWCCLCLLLKTLAKWPTLWQQEQTWLYARQWMRPPLCSVPPHPGHVWDSLCCAPGCELWSVATMSVSCSWTTICDWFFLAASLLLYLATVVVSVRSNSCKRSSTVSPSCRPSMIWSLILFACRL